MVKSLREPDSALPIVLAIVSVVPVSSWSFARIQPTGDLTALLASPAGGSNLSGLALEFKRQRVTVKRGPRISATLGARGDYESGITLLFADARADFGILTLFRSSALGLFTSSEVGMLAFALESASDRLAAVRTQPERRIEDRLEPVEAALYVLDRNLEIVLAWTNDAERCVALTGLRTSVAKRLPAILEESVRHLTSGWYGDSLQQPGVARPVPFLVLRTQPMSGPAGTYIGVSIERVREPKSLIEAAARFHISPRELEVLTLLLDGSHLDEISQLLHITSSTVQDHIKHMVGKTESRNRSELIAHVLGWESMPGPRPG